MSDTPTETLPPPNLKAIGAYKFGDSRITLTSIHKLVTDTLKVSEKEQHKLADDLTDLLDKSITLDAKRFVCRELARIGSERNAKDIVELLDHADTADIACYALHPIPGDKVEKALIDKLKKADTPTKIRILKTLKARGNDAAQSTLKKYAEHEDPEVAAAAK